MAVSAPSRGASRALLALLTIVIAVSTMVGGGAWAARAADPSFGVQFHGTWSDYTDAERTAVLATLRDHGARTVRIDVSWAMLQPNGPGEFDEWGQAQVDKAIDAALAQGLKPLVTLWLAPQWATGSADERVPPSTPAALAAWRAFARQVATTYAGRVDAWEVWNEPNSADFMRGASPRTYARVLNSAYRGLKAGSPTTPVVFGGTMYVDVPWIRKVFAAGGVRYDVMGVHPYQGVADEAPDAKDNGTKWRMAGVTRLRALMRAHGHSRSIWFTEFGWQVKSDSPDAANWERGVTAEQQGRYLVGTFEQIHARWPYVDRVYWYRDRADSQDDDRTGYGLVKPDGSATVALEAASAYLSR